MVLQVLSFGLLADLNGFSFPHQVLTFFRVHFFDFVGLIELIGQVVFVGSDFDSFAVCSFYFGFVFVVLLMVRNKLIVLSETTNFQSRFSSRHCFPLVGLGRLLVRQCDHQLDFLVCVW